MLQCWWCLSVSTTETGGWRLTELSLAAQSLDYRALARIVKCNIAPYTRELGECHPRIEQTRAELKEGKEPLHVTRHREFNFTPSPLTPPRRVKGLSHTHGSLQKALSMIQVDTAQAFLFRNPSFT